MNGDDEKVVVEVSVTQRVTRTFHTEISRSKLKEIELRIAAAELEQSKPGAKPSHLTQLFHQIELESDRRMDFSRSGPDFYGFIEKLGLKRLRNNNKWARNYRTRLANPKSSIGPSRRTA